MLPYPAILSFVRQIAPTWRKTQQANLARLIVALLERENLALTDLARSFPRPTQPLHGRLKRLERFLDNPRLDEGALFVRWLKLAYRLGADLPQRPGEKPLVPLLLDTVYFEPFAMLVGTVPCGSRGLPVALTTYHRRELAACIAPRAAWPDPDVPNPPRPRRREARRGKAKPGAFLSQNRIEEEVVDYAFALLSPALVGVTVADQGFARASFLRFHHDRQRHFVIRFDAPTHIRLPQPLRPGGPTQGPPADVLGIRPGQVVWCPEAFYGREEQVPIALLAVWDVGQKEPWHLATDLQDPEAVETLYRWRMRLECANRDEKTGVILREGGDQHARKSVVHLHRPLLALAATEWLLALVGLQALSALALADDQPLVPPRRCGRATTSRTRRSSTRARPIPRRSSPIAASVLRPPPIFAASSPGAPSATSASGGRSSVRPISARSPPASAAGSPPTPGPGYPSGTLANYATACAPGGLIPPDSKRGTASTTAA